MKYFTRSPIAILPRTVWAMFRVGPDAIFNQHDSVRAINQTISFRVNSVYSGRREQQEVYHRLVFNFLPVRPGGVCFLSPEFSLVPLSLQYILVSLSSFK